MIAYKRYINKDLYFIYEQKKKAINFDLIYNLIYRILIIDWILILHYFYIYYLYFIL